MHRLVGCLLLLATGAAAATNTVREAYCRPNQVVNKITVYEDGAIEAECGPIPCGSSGQHCSDDLAACKEADVFSGMKWSRTGQSLQLRCCSLDIPNKIYVGTDLVALGSYYTGNLVSKKEMFANQGPEYDYVSNVRAEQGGVRIWVYRIMCPAEEVADVHNPRAGPHEQHIAHEPEPQQQPTMTAEQRRQNVLQQLSQQHQQQEEQVAASLDEEVEQAPVNPLQYRPPARMARQKDSPMAASRRVL